NTATNTKTNTFTNTNTGTNTPTNTPTNTVTNTPGAGTPTPTAVISCYTGPLMDLGLEYVSGGQGNSFLRFAYQLTNYDPSPITVANLTLVLYFTNTINSVAGSNFHAGMNGVNNSNLTENVSY